MKINQKEKTVAKPLLKSLVVAALTFVALACLSGCGKPDQKELKILCWIGYDEPDFIKLVEAETGLKVSAKTFIGGDEMYSLLRQNPNYYDVVVVDPEYVEKLTKADLITTLPKEKFNFSEYFPSFRHFPLCYDTNDNLRAVLVRFGVNGLLYNTNHISAAEAESYNILWDPKLKGRVLLFDWYLPNMGVMSRIAGNTNPYNITDAQFAEVKTKLSSVGPQVKAMQTSFADMIAGLANEEFWVQPTAGETLASILQSMGKPIDWTVPKEGAIMWCETLAIPQGAKNPEGAVRFIQFMQTAKAQAALARRKAYIGSVPNANAYPLLTDAEKNVLKIHNEAEAEALIAKLSVRNLPRNQKESEWQEAWQGLKANFSKSESK
jgi:spermidine/putrescine transport system substrate-binding protein